MKEDKLIIRYLLRIGISKESKENKINIKKIIRTKCIQK